MIQSVTFIKNSWKKRTVLILNKSDLLIAEQVEVLEAAMKSEYPGKIILHQNSLNDQDVSRWLAMLELVTQEAPGLIEA